MSNTQTIKGTAEAWESGKLGVSAEHTRRVSSAVAQQIDDVLGLQAISIRLPKTTIQAYKDVAEIHGVGYQPLMREAICRWVDAEIKGLISGRVQSQKELKPSRAENGAAKEPQNKARDRQRMKKAA